MVCIYLYLAYPNYYELYIDKSHHFIWYITLPFWYIMWCCNSNCNIYDKTYNSCYILLYLSQIRYSLVMILGLNSVSGVQYKNMMIDRWWKVSIGIIDVVKSEI